jgi:hypothetical protein
MGIERRLAALPILLAGLAIAGAPIVAQDAISPATVPASDYFYSLDPSGAPVFTQVLHWEADPNALEYRITLKSADGEQLLDSRTSETSLDVHLQPGGYSYKIVTYNLLGKPEAETDWIDMRVIKAEQPAPSSSSPSTIYMDALDGRVTILGQKLVADGAVALVGKNGARFVGKVSERKGDQEIVVTFPDEAYQPGDYSIYIENPGGLNASLDDALKIRFQRPVDLLVSSGYSPFVPLYDDWFVENWSSTFNPIGADAQLELFFVKQRWGFVGIEAVAQWRRMYGGEENATLTSDFVLAGANLLYKYRFARQLHGLARIGGGVSWSYHSFDYDGFAGPTTDSYDPYAQAGIALQAFLPFKLYGEIGADCACVFLLNHYALGIAPRFSVGYQLY